MINIQNYFTKKSKLFSRKGLYEFLGEQYALLPAKSKILLVGSGGEIAEHLNRIASKKNFILKSIDIDEKQKPDIIGDICIYDFNNKKYDVVILAEVLEHTHSPQNAINNIYSALKNGGKLIITVPFIFPIHDKPYDYFRFTRYGLELLLEKFNSIMITEKNNWGEAITVLFVRHVIEKHIGRYFLVIVAFFAYPLLKTLGNIFKTNAYTTGYYAIAVK